MPYGEYLPGRSIWLVNKLLGGLVPGDFASGPSMEPLKLEKPAGVQIIPLVCFEDTVGELARQFVRDAPQLLVNCTNDGWFLHSIQNEQHLMNARFRCIELHRPMVRAANTGVTCYVGSDGRLSRGDRLEDPKTGSVFIKGVLPKEVHLLKHPPITFYAEHGDLFSIVMLVIAGLAVPLTDDHASRRRASQKTARYRIGINIRASPSRMRGNTPSLSRASWVTSTLSFSLSAKPAFSSEVNA